MALKVPDGFSLIDQIFAKHRNLSLAERHLKELQRQFPQSSNFFVRIAERRNALGQFANNGHYFTFNIYQLIEEEEEPEYGGAFDS